MAAIGLAEPLLVQAQTCFGTYILSLTSDDASYLWLDNPARHATLLSSEAIIKNSGQHAAQTGSATVALTAGNHGIVVHFGEQDGENVLILAYSGSDTGNPSVVVPATGHSYRWCSLGSQASPSQTYETLDRAPLAGFGLLPPAAGRPRWYYGLPAHRGHYDDDQAGRHQRPRGAGIA